MAGEKYRIRAWISLALQIGGLGTTLPQPPPTSAVPFLAFQLPPLSCLQWAWSSRAVLVPSTWPLLWLPLCHLCFGSPKEEPPEQLKCSEEGFSEMAG